MLGAAVLWAVAPNYAEYMMRVPFVDDLVHRFGVSFAAETAVLGAGLTISYHQPSREAPTVAASSVGPRSPADTMNFGIYEPHSRLRSMVAGLDDAEYIALTHTLGTHRGSVFAQNLTTSFLLPTEQDWLSEDVGTLSTVDEHHYQVGLPLLAGTTALEQAEHFFDLGPSRDHTIWMIGQRINLVYSMCANIGPGSEYLVAEIFEGNVSAQHKKKAVSILAQFDTDAAFELLLDRLGQKYIEPAVLEAMAGSPERTARLLASRKPTTATATLLSDHVKVHPTLASVLPEVKVTEASTPPVSAPRVPSSELPPLLADPPWKHRRRRTPPIVLTLQAPVRPLSTAWKSGEREAWKEYGEMHRPWVNRSWEDIVADIMAQRPTHCFDALAYAPEDLVSPLLTDQSLPQRYWHSEHHLRRILGRFDSDAAPYILQISVARPASNAHLLLPIDGSEISAHMMRWLGSKSLRPTAQQWFDRHIQSAAADVVVTALGTPGADRSRAETTLRELDRTGHRGVLLETARSYGKPAEVAVTGLLDADPLAQLPSRMPTLPDWLNPILLQPVTIRDTDRAVPDESILHICTMFALSRPDDVYAGIEILRELVDSDSLADMAWSLFERWSGAGFPTAQGWVLDALGIVGNDDTARKLTPLILTWPLQSAHRRAAAGLEVLANIGTDAALGALWRISQGLRFPALREKADGWIRRIADELGLSPLELADRLVPDLDLDANGTTVFDYGSRSFLLTFDEKLRPLVFDSDERQYARLPRPGPADSAHAAAEYKRYTILKKDLGAVSAELITRLEHAMISGRRWTMANLRTHLVEHPLMWHLTSRLIWSTVADADQPNRTFRFSQFRTPIAADGIELTIDDATEVSLPHPVNLGPARSIWADVLHELGLVQPFEQTERATFDGEIGPILAALEGRKTPTRQLLALKAFGWIREEPQDRGAQISLSKQVDTGRQATMMVFPGFNAANALQWEEQKIIHVFVTGERNPPALSPIAASELARDLATVDVQPVTGNETDFDGAPE